MSRYQHSLRTRLLGHSSQFQKIVLCVFGITLAFFATTFTLCTFDTASKQGNLNPPSTSIRTITGLITLTSISVSDASLDDIVTVSGDAQKWNGAAWDAYVGEIVLAVQTNFFTVKPTIYSSYTTTSNALGHFDLQFTIIDDFFGENHIFANTTEGGYDTNCTNYQTLFVHAAADIQVTRNLQPVLSGSSHYNVSGTVYNDITGNPYSGAGFNLEVWLGDQGTGSFIDTIAVNGADGSFNDVITHDPNYDYFTLYYAGGPTLLGGETRADFYVLTSIEVKFNALPRTIYQNTTISISGSVTDGQGFPLTGSQVSVEIEGVSNGIIFHGILGPAGVFINSNFTVPIATGTFTIRITLENLYTYGIHETPGVSITASQSIRIRPDSFFNSFPWEFILIGVGAVGVIIGIFFFQRWLMKQRSEKDRKELMKEIEERLENVRVLYTMGRVKEALAYLYVTYTDIAQFKHGIEKQASQTTTEFAILMVKQFGQNPQNIYPFIQEIEQVIYGGYPYNEQVFMHAVQLFGQIYLELMERPLPSFQLS
jgi:hypothetical protein